MIRNLLATVLLSASAAGAAAQPKPGFAFYPVGTTADLQTSASRQYWAKWYAGYEKAKAAGADPARMMMLVQAAAPASPPAAAPAGLGFSALGFGPPRSR